MYKELQAKDTEIFELKTKVTENNSKLGKRNEMQMKLEALEEEVHIWERTHSQWMNTFQQNKKLSAGILYRDKYVISSLSTSLKEATEKIRYFIISIIITTITENFLLYYKKKKCTLQMRKRIKKDFSMSYKNIKIFSKLNYRLQKKENPLFKRNTKQ